MFGGVTPQKAGHDGLIKIPRNRFTGFDPFKILTLDIPSGNGAEGLFQKNRIAELTSNPLYTGQKGLKSRPTPIIV
jgi:hypothetical protein